MNYEGKCLQKRASISSGSDISLYNHDTATYEITCINLPAIYNSTSSIVNVILYRGTTGSHSPLCKIELAAYETVMFEIPKQGWVFETLNDKLLISTDVSGIFVDVYGIVKNVVAY